VVGNSGHFNHIYIDTEDGKPRMRVLELLKITGDHVDEAHEISKFVWGDINMLRLLITNAQKVLDHFEE